MVLCGCSRGSRGVFLRRGRECWRSSVSRQRRQRRRRPATAVDRPTTESTTVTTRQHLSTQGQHQEQKGQVKSTLVVPCLLCLCPSCAPADKPSSFHSVMQHQFFVFHSTVLHTNKGQHGIRRQVFESQFLIFWGVTPLEPFVGGGYLILRTHPVYNLLLCVWLKHPWPQCWDPNHLRRYGAPSVPIKNKLLMPWLVEREIFFCFSQFSVFLLYFFVSIHFCCTRVVFSLTDCVISSSGFVRCVEGANKWETSEDSEAGRRWWADSQTSQHSDG